jgi:hypothetical protein
LTDRFPSETARQLAQRYAPQQLHYVADPIDATQVPSELKGFRTLFTAFHHFAPQDAQRILQDAVDQRQGIAIFEQTRRHPLAILLMLALPWLALLTVPLMRPFRWSRLLWTYVIPAIPYVLAIDGVISCLRTYSSAEMQELVARVDAPGYVWQVGRVRSPVSPVGVLYLIGYPAVTAS